MKYLFILTLFFASFLTIAQNEIDADYKEMIEKKYNFPTISQDDAQAKLKNDNIVFIDTREWKEYAVSHIPGAIFTGYDNFMWQNLNTIDKNAEIVVYCSIGVRSQNIGEKLKEKGFTNVKNLYGGLFLWADQERPMETKDGNDTDKVHGYNKFWGKWVKKAETVYE